MHPHGSRIISNGKIFMPPRSNLDQVGTGRATLTGFSAVLMWSLLAALTVATGRVPPFQLAALCFTIGGGLGLIWTLVRGEAGLFARQPAKVWLHGIGGIFGYHFLYFTALRHGSPAEVSLIAYLWPLLIVLLSVLLPGHQLRKHHLAGALLGFAGAVVIVRGSGGGTVQTDLVGYAAAVACALIWSGYSVSARLLVQVPTALVTGVCLISAVLAAFCHLLFESTVWPAGSAAWLAVLALGAGPVGLAFYLWDYGCKHGDLRVLGGAAYLAPLLSTAVLLVFGLDRPRLSIVVAAVLITAGALVAARDLIQSARGGSSAAW